MAQVDSDSSVVWAATADWERPSARPMPGRLLVTGDRLRFVPRAGEEGAQGAAWDTALVDIVDVILTDWPPLMGRRGRRKRIRIETAHGEPEIFAVARVSHAVEVLRVAVRAAGGNPAP